MVKEADMAKKGTGFNAPTIGNRHPKGATIRKNKDGTITVVPPKSTKKGKK